jgi:hypothetical protein
LVPFFAILENIYRSRGVPGARARARAAPPRGRELETKQKQEAHPPRETNFAMNNSYYILKFEK